MPPVTSSSPRVSDVGEDDFHESASETYTPTASPATTTPTSTTASSSTSVHIGSLNIETIDDAVDVQDQGPLYTKASRDLMTPDKKNDLFKEAIKTSQARYDFTSLNLTDEKRLDDIYNMSIMISKTRTTHIQYDMASVFTILVPTVPGGKTLQNTTIGDTRVPTTYDLYTQYDELTEEQVAHSCEWYNKWTAKQWYRDDLILTFKHLENNMTHKLFDKAFERYETYPKIQRGGPLLFIIMMKLLVSNTEESTKHLKTMIKALKIADFKGKNVQQVVSLIWGAHKRLLWLKKVPDDFTLQILDVLQTSSVADFNDHFFHYKKTFEMMQDMTETGTSTPPMDLDKLLRIAENKYKSLMSSGDWTGSKTKGRSSVFVQASEDTKPTTNSAQANVANQTPRRPVCWNCGGIGHTVTQCTKPRDEKRIADEKAKFLANKSTSSSSTTPTPSTSTSKWRQPTPEENNRRMIDGKPMFYNRRVRRWVADRDHSTQGNVAAPTPSTPPPSSTSKTATFQTKNAELEAALTNTSRTIEASLRGLMDHFQSE